MTRNWLHVRPLAEIGLHSLELVLILPKVEKLTLSVKHVKRVRKNLRTYASHCA